MARPKLKLVPKPHSATARFVVRLPWDLALEIEQVLVKRGLDFEEVVNLYVRSLITVTKRQAALGLEDPMPIGKYKDTPLGVVIRAEPRYVAWLTANVETLRFTPEALALLETALNTKDDHA